MRRPSRLRRIAKWTGGVVSVVLAAGWILSGFWYIGWNASGDFGVAIDGGTFVVFWGQQSIPLGFVYIRHWSPWGVRWLPSSSRLGSRVNLVLIPLWIPFPIVAIPTAFLFYLDRRRPGPGDCRACRYDLTGNVSGVCPECGRAL